jgi:aryl-alcohol dehydrogenase-like predicted oxidoreductase
MCKAEGMAITVWGAMGSGKFKNAEQRKDSGGRAVVNDRSFSSPEAVQVVFKVLEAIGRRKGVSAMSIALRYVTLRVTPAAEIFSL